MLPEPARKGRGTPPRGTAIRGIVVAMVLCLAQRALAHPLAASTAGALVEVPTCGRTIDGYRAAPPDKRHPPVVIVAPSNAGITDNVKMLIQRFADAGYYAIAVDYLARYEPEDGQPASRVLISRTNDDWARCDTASAIAFAGREGADTRRLGMMGLSWGARLTWTYVARDPRVHAGAAFYGALTVPGHDAKIAESPPAPLALADRVGGRVIGFYGDADARTPTSDIDGIRAALLAARDSKTTIVLYPGLSHGFFEPDRPEYTADAAADAWLRMLAWFQAHGVR